MTNDGNQATRPLRILCLGVGVGVLIVLLLRAHHWSRNGLESMDAGGLWFVLAWVFAGLGILVSAVGVANPVLCELAGWTAFLAAGLMIVAGFTSDSSRIDVMSVAPAFAFSMICIAGADHLFEPDLGRG